MWKFFYILICAFNVISGNPIPELSKEDQENLKIHVRAVENYYGHIKARIEKRSVDDEELDNGVIGLLASQFTGGNSEPSAICPACGFLIGMMQGFINDGLLDGNIIDVSAFFCKEYTKMGPEICLGLLNNNMPTLLYILRAQNFTSSEICSIVLTQECLQPGDPPRDWEVYLPPFPDSEHERTETDIPEDGPKFTVLHVSDIHLDLLYKENAPAECSLPLCCRENSGEPKPNTSMSGKYGDKKCDTPKITVEYLLQYVQKNYPEIDFIYWTGDTPAHDSWGITRNDSLLALDETISLFLKYFPNTTVLYGIGNHEAVPMNMFPTTEDIPDEYKIDWLYNALSEKLTKWLPENATSTIKFGGYYTVLIRPGFRIISLNTNFCYTDNWWLALNNTDPAQELQWLVNVLQEAEKNGEKVHIIGHVPPSDSKCLQVWQRNFYRIVNRFAGIIAGQFYGHTHKDEISLHFDENDIEKPIGVEYIGCSVTPYTYLNPCFTIFYIDGDRENSTWLPIDKMCYYFDLEEANANENDGPVWKKLYSAREAYNMTSLSPEDWKSFYEQLAYDDNLCYSYLNHSRRNSLLTPYCDNESLRRKIRPIAVYGGDSPSEIRTGDDSTISTGNGDNVTTTYAPPEGTTNIGNSYDDPTTESPDGNGSTNSRNDINSTDNPKTTDNPDGNTSTTGYDDNNTTTNTDTTSNTDPPNGYTNTENQEQA